ncbi:MAG: GntR family transcriptional regulator [Azospirillaceae bacterium]
MTDRIDRPGLPVHRTKAELVYEYLREQILSGALEPEARLTLAALSRQLGTSMMPVREALMRLEREGLVEVAPYKDVRVAPLSITDITELFSVRAVLEGHALRLAAGNEGTRLADHLEQVNARFERARADENYTEVNAANWEFHRFILDRARNHHLRRLLEDVWAKCLRYRAGFRLIPGRAESAFREHEAIIAAVRAGELDEMERICRRHIETAGREMVAYLETAGFAAADQA